jgi:hypothetical protein
VARLLVKGLQVEAPGSSHCNFSASDLSNLFNAADVTRSAIPVAAIHSSQAMTLHSNRVNFLLLLLADACDSRTGKIIICKYIRFDL